MKIDPHNIKDLPKNPGTVVAEDYLDEPQRHAYRQVVGRTRPPTSWELPLPRAFNNIDPEDEKLLINDFMCRGMGFLAPRSLSVSALYPSASDVRSAIARATDIVLPGGWFGVSSGEKLRLIFDRRPHNHVEDALRWARLPHGVKFCSLLLDRRFGCRGTGKDLRSWFFSIAHPPLGFGI